LASYIKGLQAKLVFKNESDRQKVLDLMRRFSSAVRFAYNRLVENVEPKELWAVDGPIGKLFDLDSHYIQAVLLKAKTTLESVKEKNIDPKKVVFGGRQLFLDLQKRHNPKVRRRRLKEWKEKRQGLVYCRGNSKYGNPNLRLLLENGALYLNIKIRKGEHIKALIKSSHPELDELVQRMLLNKFYNVELKLKDDKIYANFTWSEEAPTKTCTKENGILGVDVNADPYHLALALVNKEGNLKHYFTIPLNVVDQVPKKGTKETYLWMIAHELTDFALSSGVAIAIEKLKNIRKSKRGDGSGKKFRRIQHKFAYASLLSKIERLAIKKGIEVVQVNPSDTSTIGMLKYAPQLSLSKDVAAAYVIGRRGLGFKEELPKNYKALLNNPEFINDAQTFYFNLIEDLKKKLGNQKNPNLKNQLNKQILKHQKFLSLLSSQSSSRSRTKVTYGRNLYDANLWRILRVGLFLPFLGLEVPRDLSKLKPILIEGNFYQDRGEVRKSEPRSLLPGRADTTKIGSVKNFT